MKNINAKDFVLLRNEKKLLVIDIREKEELVAFPFESTVHIPASHLITKYNDLLKIDETYYIVCHHGQRSYLVSDILSSKGYDVVNVMGGVDAVNRV